MESPFANNAPAGESGAATDDFWAFNPQQPPPMTATAQGDDTSLDELLALYQTAQDAPAAAPFAPLGEPDSYPAFGGFGEAGAQAVDNAFNFGDPATDQPFPSFDAPADDAFGAGGFGGFDAAPGGDTGGFPAFDAAPAGETGGFGGFDAAPTGETGGFGGFDAAPAGDVGGFGFDAPAGDAFGFDSGPGDAFPPMGGTSPESFGAADPFGGMPETDPVSPIAFGEAEAFGAVSAADPAMAAPPFGFDTSAGDATSFGFDVPDLSGGDAVAFGLEAPAADLGGFNFDAPPAAADTGDFGFDAPDAGGFNFDAAPAADAGGFGFDAPAFDAAPAADAGGFGFDAPAGDAFGFDSGTGDDPFAMPGSPVFPALDAATAAFPAFEALPEEDDDPFAPLPGSPVFEAFDDSPPVQAAALAPVDDEPQEFFLPEDDAGMFPALDAAPAAFPAFEALPEEDDDPFAPLPGGPVFEAFEETPQAPSDFPAFDAAPEAEFAGSDFSAFEEPAPTPAPAPVFEAPTLAPAPAPVAAPIVPVAAPAHAPAAVSYDAAAVAALTGQSVGVRTADERTAAGQQVNQALGTLQQALDEAQGKLAQLYGDLQKAAVRRATVGEIHTITQELAETRAKLGQGSEAHRQALALRQVADAYLQLLGEL